MANHSDSQVPKQETFKNVQAEQITAGNITQTNITVYNLGDCPKPTGFPQNIPFSSRDEFVGRVEDLESLHQQLQLQNEVVIAAVEGMGGVGKTELAIQYSRSHLKSDTKKSDTYPGGICWLRARDEDIGLQIIQFAQTDLGLQPPDNLDFQQRVRWCWQHWKEGDTLVVLDDVNNYSRIKPYLPPQPSQFKVLITTRLKLDLPGSLILKVLSEEDALKLLARLIGEENITNQLALGKELCRRLGCLPLALKLAGSYIRKKSDITLDEYLKRLQQKGLGDPSLVVTEDDRAWTLNIKRGVAATFELSWEELSDGAKQLGCLLSLFALAPIPWVLVELCLSQQNKEKLEDLRDNELLTLSLLQRENSGIYLLHTLIRDFFAEKREEKKVKESTIQQLEKEFFHSLIDVGQNIHKHRIDKSLYLPHLVEASEIGQNLDSIKDLFKDFLDQKKILEALKVGLGIFSELMQTEEGVSHSKISKPREDNKPNNSSLAKVQGTGNSEQSVRETVKSLPLPPVPDFSKKSNANELVIRTPDRPHIANKLALARALRPLIRQVKPVIDVEATISRITEGQSFLIPALKPSLEPWLDLAFVVDEESSFPILQQPLFKAWIKPLIRNLEQSFQVSGVFRNVTSWTMFEDDNEEVKICRQLNTVGKRQGSTYPETLIDPTRCPIILILSNCTSSIWYSGAVESVLERWTHSSPVVLIQLLPKRLWQKTALRHATSVSVKSLAPETPNKRLFISSKSSQTENPPGVTKILLPVISKEGLSQELSDWAKLISGSADACCSGFMFQQKCSAKEKISDSSEIVQSFLREATENVQQLAKLLAASPKITFPIANLIRSILLPSSDILDLFEVLFMSRLMKYPLNKVDDDLNPYETELDFIDPKIRQILKTHIPHPQLSHPNETDICST